MLVGTSRSYPHGEDFAEEDRYIFRNAELRKYSMKPVPGKTGATNDSSFGTSWMYSIASSNTPLIIPFLH